MGLMVKISCSQKRISVRLPRYLALCILGSRVRVPLAVKSLFVSIAARKFDRHDATVHHLHHPLHALVDSIHDYLPPVSTPLTPARLPYLIP